MACSLEYAGMDACNLAIWVVLATLAGAWARSICQGKMLMGPWGDMMIGLIGAFVVGQLFDRLHIDPSRVVFDEPRTGLKALAVPLINVFVTAFIGSLITRLGMRLAKQ